MTDKDDELLRGIERLLTAGADADVVQVNINPTEVEGFLVTCLGCGRTARLPFALPAGKVVMCPTCVRDLR